MLCITYGYSPNQLVFGKNLQCSLPLEGQTSSEIIANRLNAMDAARAAFIKSEGCEKIRIAFRAKTRTATFLIYAPEDRVYFEHVRRKGTRYCDGKRK